MSFVLYMEPNTVPLTRHQFLKKAPQFSIAIDGYCAEAPFYDQKGKRLNLNHHDNVSRDDTRATCAQALMKVRCGLYKRFQTVEGKPTSSIFANDCDEDVCLTHFILTYPHLVAYSINPLLNRLVHMEDMLDTTAGAYSFPPHMNSMEELMWIFDPYHRFRVGGGLDRRNVNEYTGIVKDVEMRILQFLSGNGLRKELDTRFEVLDKRESFSLVKEIGTNARIGLYATHIDAFISVRTRPDGKYVYSIGKQSIFVRFGIEDICQVLNDAEGNTNERWGGGNLIIGSPRVSGSEIPPQDVVRMVGDLATINLASGAW